MRLLSDMNFTKNWLCVTKRITSFADVEMPIRIGRIRKKLKRHGIPSEMMQASWHIKLQ